MKHANGEATNVRPFASPALRTRVQILILREQFHGDRHPQLERLGHR
jgi:hypothetical protein